MDVQSASLTSQPSPRWSQHVYPAVVLGLATFLLLTFVLPSPIESYRAIAVINQQFSTTPNDTADVPRIDARDVARAADEVLQQGKVQLPRNVHRDDVMQCEIVQTSASTTQITLATRCRHAHQALNLCDEVAARLVASQPTAYVPNQEVLNTQRADVEQRLLLVRESKKQLEAGLASAEREHFAAFSLLVQRLLAAGIAASADASAGTGAPASPSIEMYNQLVKLRGELARTRTNEHPQIRDLDERLQQARQRLAALPSPPRASASGTGYSEAEQAAQLRQLQSLDDAYQLKSSELLAALANAQQREELLLGEQARLAIEPIPIVLSTSIAERPTVLERRGGGTSPVRLMVYMVVAGIAGTITFWLFRRSAANNRIRSPSDIRGRLGLPVVSLINVTNETTPPSPSARSIRHVLLLAELVLIVIAVSITAAMMRQPELTQSVTADPFGAVAEAIDRSVHGVVRR